MSAATTRRQPNAEGPRVKRYVVKVTAADQARLESLAEERSVTVPRLLVESALLDRAETEQTTFATPAERQTIISHLFRLERLTLNAANNVNQIARYAHDVRGFPEGAHDALLMARGVATRIDEFLREFGLEGRRRTRATGGEATHATDA